MLTEINILFDNVKNFRRKLLSEGVNQSSMVDAINDHKIVYIYYAGDDTVQPGYRTIKPFVVGTHKKSGNPVVRAWQDAGSSDSYNNIKYHNWANAKRQDHEYHFDHKGRMKPGWRLFRLDKIVSMLPTGEQFKPENIINNNRGVKYNPNDKDINVVKAIQPSSEKTIDVDGTDSIHEPDTTAAKVDKSAFDDQTSKFQRFFKAGRRTRQATKDEIENLFKINQKIKKKPARKMWVVQNEKGDMILKDENQKSKIPSDSIVGNLKDLYNKFVVPDRKYDTSFFDKVKSKNN